MALAAREHPMPIELREHGPHIAVVTIDNQPRRNAMSRAMLGDIAALWDRLENSACRCVVVTGAGDRAFTSGADVSGDLSAGEELLLSTDIRAAVPGARFGLTEVKWSIYPFGGATVKLIHQIGYVHAMDLLLTGRLIDAPAAERIGLVNLVLPPDRLMPWAIETAEAIAANSPSAVQAVKQQISASIADYAQSREALDQELGDRVRASPHFKEGIAAFREKRPPNYS
jgi:enoyl-CoA hydratase